MSDTNSGKERQLAAILFADIQGYTRLMQQDEKEASTLLRKFQNVLAEETSRHHGTIANEMGDGMLCTFKSSLDAVRCGKILKERFEQSPHVPVRIGIHSGTVVKENQKIYGNSVNIASRIESLGVPGAVLVSKSIKEDLKNQSEFSFTSLGKVRFKNIDELMEVFAIYNEGFIIPDLKKSDGKFEKEKSGIYKYWPLIFGLFILFVIVFFWNWFKNEKPQTIKSIAVLPFDNNGNEEDAYFALGVTEDILTQISKIGDLKVLSRFTLNDYDHEGKPPRQIGKELSIGYLLAGSIRRSGDDLRISCQLIDTNQETEEWSEIFDRKMENIFTVQRDIAFEVARLLKAQLSGEEQQRINQAPTNNLIAYNLYLKGREEYFRYNAESNEEAIRLFKEALLLDPEFALAIAGLSDAYSQSVDRDKTRDASYIDTALVLGQKAMDLNPEIAEAWKALGLALYFKGSLREAMDMYLNALEKNPNHAPSMANIALILSREGKTVEALDKMLQVTELSPINPILYSNIGQYYMKLELWDDAIENLQTSISLNPANWYPNYYEGLVHILNNQPEKAIPNIKMIISIDSTNSFMLEKAGDLAHYFDQDLATIYFDQALSNPNYNSQELGLSKIGKAYVLSEEGKIDESNELLNNFVNAQLVAIENGGTNEVQLLLVAAAFAIQSDNKNALKYLGQLKNTGYNSYLLLQANPWFSSLEGNEEFQTIMGGMKEDIEKLKREYEMYINDKNLKG